MANITQTIPALTAGISQQPDEQKIPGQVRDMVNALPDVTQGLLKRPAGRFVGSLSDGGKNSSADGKWFHYYRDENEQYIGQVHKDGTVRMWDCLTGDEKNVTNAIGNSTYLTHTNDEDIQTLTLNDFTYLTNRSINTEMDTTEFSAPQFEKEVYVELKAVAYAKQYGLNLFDNTTTATETTTTATRISLAESNLDNISTCPNVGTEIYSLGSADSKGTTAIQKFRWKLMIGSSNESFFIPYISSNQHEQYHDFTFYYCPPPWEAGRIYRAGDLVTGNANNGVNQTVYRLKAGSTTRETTVNETAPTHTNGDGPTVNGHTWEFIDSDVYNKATTNQIPEDQLYDGQRAIKINWKHGPNDHENFCSDNSTACRTQNDNAVQDVEDQFATTAASVLPFTVLATRYDHGATDQRVEIDLTWKHAGYYEDHRTRIIWVRKARLRTSTPNLGSVYQIGLTYGGGTATGDYDSIETTGWDEPTLPSGRSDLYFRITTTGQAVPVDKEGVSTDDYTCRYTTTLDLLHGGSGWQEGDQIVFLHKNGRYRIKIDKISTSEVRANLGLIRPTPTSFDSKTTVTADSILGDMRSAIIAQPGFNAADVEQIGSGLYIKKGAKFSASTPVKELLNVVASQVNDIGDLPSQCKHGMVVEVINSAADEDNHYVQFHGNGGLDGAGVWEECAKPGRKNRFDYAKMPITLIRTADGNFRLAKLDGGYYHFSTELVDATYSNGATGDIGITLTNHGYKAGDLIRVEKQTDGGTIPDDYYIVKESVNVNSIKIEGIPNLAINVVKDIKVARAFQHPIWEDALVGDDVTNPEPSFIGKPINKMLFFRNRLALLSEEHIILSRPGEFFNFFAASAIQFVPSDPIDISASSTYPATLYDGIQVNAGLILFSKNQQFMLTTDSDILSVQTAKINSIATYNFNYSTNPISLGTTIGFLDNAGKHTRFFEMASVLREGEPEVIEQSAVVSKLFNNDLRLISNSRENSVIFFSEEGTSTLYGYRYFDQINQRKLASWFKWELTGDIQYHCVQDDSLFVVVRNNSKDQLLKFSIVMDVNTQTVSVLHRVHLDHLMSTSGWTYNATTKKSTKAKSSFTGLESTNQLAAYDVDAGEQLGRYAKVNINGSNYEIDGDWSNQTFLIGYLYTMKVDLPTIYYTTQVGERWKADTRSNTIIHRIKLGLGPIGLFKTKLTRRGKEDYEEDHEPTLADAYSASTAAIVDDIILKSIPVYDRNINTKLTIESTHPAPATLYQMTWEGVYNNNHYKSV